MVQNDLFSSFVCGIIYTHCTQPLQCWLDGHGLSHFILVCKSPYLAVNFKRQPCLAVDCFQDNILFYAFSAMNVRSDVILFLPLEVDWCFLLISSNTLVCILYLNYNMSCRDSSLIITT